MLILTGVAMAQDVIPLYQGTAPGSTKENYPEKQYFSKAWNTEVVTNVTRPTLTVFKPAPELRNGTAVVICPGGGFMALDQQRRNRCGPIPCFQGRNRVCVEVQTGAHR
jgi:hypothetical protein